MEQTITATTTDSRFQLGDGVSWGQGTDRVPGTVVRVTPRAVFVVADDAELLNGTTSGQADALHFAPGGFVGHTSGRQRYQFTGGNGPAVRFSWRKGSQRFQMAGTSSTGSMGTWGLLSHGRYKHYDFNF